MMGARYPNKQILKPTWILVGTAVVVILRGAHEVRFEGYKWRGEDSGAYADAQREKANATDPDFFRKSKMLEIPDGIVEVARQRLEASAGHDHLMKKTYW